MNRLLLLIALIATNGCAKIKINATMCDRVASEPNVVMPQECQDYDKEKAKKAFNKVKDEKKTDKKDLEFSIEDKED